MELSSFQNFAPYLKDPLVLIGFFIFIVFLLLRSLIVRGIIPTVGRTQGYNLLRLILLYGFIFGVVLMGLGFGLKYRELDEKEETNLVNQLKTEFRTNNDVISELKNNTETFLNVSIELSNILRTQSITILPILFPHVNLDLDSSVNSIELSNKAFNEIVSKKLHNNELEMNRLRAVANVIIATVEKTHNTLISLADTGRVKYTFSKEIWESNIEVYKQVHSINITDFQEAYKKLATLRNSYDVVAKNCIDFQETVSEFFNPTSNKLTKENLAVVLSKERQVYVLIHDYTLDIYNKTKELQEFQDKINIK